MKQIKIVLVMAALIGLPISKVDAGEPPKELVEKLTAVIRKHCPEARVGLTNGIFQASHGTMVFTVHGHSMTGEISAATHQEEGPNFKGFMLRVSVQDGPYQGQAVVPQTLSGPYYPTFIDAPPVAGRQQHYWLSFAYGSRVDPELKKAIFDALPNSIMRK